MLKKSSTRVLLLLHGRARCWDAYKRAVSAQGLEHMLADGYRTDKDKLLAALKMQFPLRCAKGSASFGWKPLGTGLTVVATHTGGMPIGRGRKEWLSGGFSLPGSSRSVNGAL